MGIVESISMEGYRMWYHSSDHLPPHFHCKRVSEWEIRVYFLDCSEEDGLSYDVKWGRDPGGRFRKELNELVLQNACGFSGNGKRRLFLNECVRHKIFKMVKILTKKRKGRLSLVLLDELFEGKIASKGNHRLFTSIRSKKLAGQKNVVIVSKASGLRGISKFVREMNEKNHLKGLFIRPDVKTELLPKLMHESGVSTLKHTFIHQNPDALCRLLRAWNLGAPGALIADASVADNTLFVVGCSFQFYTIPFAELPALRNIAPENRHSFQIDEDGSYLHWSHDDIHIDIDTLEYHTNPEYRKKADLKRLQYNRTFGDSLKRLRKEAGLRQCDIPGLSARQVRRIENGETPVSVGALEKVAEATGITVEGILRKQMNKRTE